MSKHVLLEISTLSTDARRELTKSQAALKRAGYSGSRTQAIRVALDQWAREIGGAENEIKGGVKTRKPAKSAKKGARE